MKIFLAGSSTKEDEECIISTGIGRLLSYFDVRLGKKGFQYYKLNKFSGLKRLRIRKGINKFSGLKRFRIRKGYK